MDIVKFVHKKDSNYKKYQDNIKSLPKVEIKLMKDVDNQFTLIARNTINIDTI
jgi:hypothetical protein